MNSENNFVEEAIVDSSLYDLLQAYELVADVANESKGKAKKQSVIAANLIDMSLSKFSKYASKPARNKLEKSMAKIRLRPLVE